MKRSGIHADHLIDAIGQMICVGDRATLIHIDRLFLYGLPTDRQDSYEAQLDKIVIISDLDDCGTVAIAFQDESGVRQEYWVEPGWLRRLPI